MSDPDRTRTCEGARATERALMILDKLIYYCYNTVSLLKAPAPLN
jgi:hypothetical protein